MWVRKTDREIAAQDRRDRLNPIGPLVVGILFAVALTFSKRSGWTGKLNLIVPDDPLNAVFTSLPLSLVWCSLVAYAVNFLSGGNINRIRHDLTICPSCKQIVDGQSEIRCDCRAEREPLRNWRWVNEE